MVLVTFGSSVHNAKIMLGMLVKVLRGDSIATRRRLAREGNVTFEDLMRATPNFDVRTVTIEGLTSMRYLLPVTVGIITVMATMRSAGLFWSHHTCRIDGETGSLSNESISEPLPSGGGGCRTAFPYKRKALWRRHPRLGRLYLQRVFGATPHRSGSDRRPGHVMTVTRLDRAAAPLPLEHHSRVHLQGGRLPIPLRCVGRHDDRTRTHRVPSGGDSLARGCSARLRDHEGCPLPSFGISRSGIEWRRMYPWRPAPNRVL